MAIFNVVRKLLTKRIDSNSTPNEIIQFKQNAWMSKKMSDYYDREVETSFFNAVTFPLFSEGIARSSNVLDVGAGTGRLSIAFGKMGCNVMAVDISKNQLAKINDFCKSQAECEALKIQTLESSAFSIPCPSESFDIVTSMDLMSHFPNWDEILIEKARLCKKGGRVIFNCLSKENLTWLEDPKAVAFNKGDALTTSVSTAIDRPMLEHVAAKISLSIESIHPYNFFAGNSMFGSHMTSDEIVCLASIFDKLVKNGEVLSLLEKFEKSFISSLPASHARAIIVKLKKDE